MSLYFSLYSVCYHILEILFTLETRSAMWSLRTSLQLVLILDKYCRNSWVHLNWLNLSFHKKIISSKFYCPFLSWQTNLNEKSNKSTFHDKAAKQREFICFKYSPGIFTYSFFKLSIIFKVLSTVIHLCNSSTKGVEARDDFWGYLGYIESSGPYLDTKWELALKTKIKKKLKKQLQARKCHKIV